MNAPHPHSTVERHLVPPPPPIPPAPFETERFLCVQTAHAWRATRHVPALRWSVPATVAAIAATLLLLGAALAQAGAA